jgi:hypothetical protein
MRELSAQFNIASILSLPLVWDFLATAWNHCFTIFKNSSGNCDFTLILVWPGTACQQSVPYRMLISVSNIGYMHVRIETFNTRLAKSLGPINKLPVR